jgi:hypothetical protein
VIEVGRPTTIGGRRLILCLYATINRRIKQLKGLLLPTGGRGLSEGILVAAGGLLRLRRCPGTSGGGSWIQED